jgi:hypothetical protein
MLSGQYTCRWFQESDLDAYIRGLNETLYEEYDETRFHWKMVDTPWSLGFVSIATVEHNGVPVAFNSFLPLQVRRGCDSFTVIQGCDGFVEPEHRHMGLFQETLKFMFREFASAGPEMLMGFNFSGSAGAAQKVGSTLIGDIYALCANASDLTARSVEGEDTVNTTPCSLDELHHIYEGWATNTTKFHYLRSPEYLRWRYSHPLRRSSFYRINDAGEEGYVALSLEKDGASNTLFIDDYTPMAEKARVISAMVKYVLARGEPINEVFITTSKCSPIYAIAQTLGFTPDHFYTLIMKNIRGLEVRDKKLFKGDIELTDVSGWHITSSDVF